MARSNSGKVKEASSAAFLARGRSRARAGGDSQGGNAQGNDEAGFIPQILMNPWDPQQAPMMTLAPIANAMQQYQQQWLTQYQQVRSSYF